jgi:predicted secreted protein
VSGKDELEALLRALRKLSRALVQSESRRQMADLLFPDLADHKLHAEAYEWFEIGFDHFGRTSTEKQTECVDLSSALLSQPELTRLLSSFPASLL